MSVAAISDPLASRTRGRVMADYRVLFFNNLVNSYGKPFKCLQRAITVSSAKDAGEASEKAKREFERLEHVPDWKFYAQFLEVESRDIQLGGIAGDPSRLSGPAKDRRT
jgi:hypothetical protein